jgi:hypothetical protein
VANTLTSALQHIADQRADEVRQAEAAGMTGVLPAMRRSAQRAQDKADRASNRT